MTENHWRHRPWSEGDRESLLSEVRSWAIQWQRGEPCPICGWPFPNAFYHLHDDEPEVIAPKYDG